MDHHFTGFPLLRNDTIQTVSAFSNAKVLSCFVQQGCICWKPDILRSTGGVQNQDSMAFFLTPAAFVRKYCR